MKLLEIANVGPTKFKALFLAGPPASGKSHLYNSGNFPPHAYLNTDNFRHSEARRKQVDLNDINNEKHIISGVIDETTAFLFNNIIYGEPLIIETTADRKNNFEKRVSTLKTLGYDVSIVYTHTTKELSFDAEQQRRSQEGRTVDPAAMKKMWEEMPTRLAEIAHLVGKDNFLYIPRDQMAFSDDQRTKLQQFTRDFMIRPNENPKGASFKRNMAQTPQSTTITLSNDNVYQLYMLLSGWFDK